MDLVTFCLIVAVWQLMIGIPALIHPARFEKWWVGLLLCTVGGLFVAAALHLREIA